MAQTKFIISLVLLALIFCLRFYSLEGRHLKMKNEGDHDQKETRENLVKHGEYVHGGGITRNEATLSPPSPTTLRTTDADGASPPNRDVEDFRPTSPGHSPGVGHSNHN
ncbi:hypothetical protein L6164_027808 [Bauhinia variegata]|uniref:Uncharacterized protein n=1 Tax=Bauhinia variegata TaxID=167791 RepID=A0ACB9LV78_BAUVA|nr:hypothetical protein L6164_027808 [Bauhinia variegata]